MILFSEINSYNLTILTIAVVNIGAVSGDFFLASLDTYRVSCEEECMPSFDVVNCLLNLLATSFGDEVGFSLLVQNDCFILCRWFRLAINCLDSSPQLGGVCLEIHGLHELLPFGLLVCGRCSGDFIIYTFQFRRGVISLSEVIPFLRQIQDLSWHRFSVELVFSRWDVV